MNTTEGSEGELYRSVCTMPVLKQAFRKVKRNGGKPGDDGQTILEFEADLVKNLQTIMLELLTGSYLPGWIRRVFIPKSNGRRRKLGIPNVRDRIVQAAILIVLEPIFEAMFHNSSFGFRPKRACHHAIEHLSRLMKEGNVWIVDVDIVAFFDTIPHDKLMQVLANYILDQRMLDLIRLFLLQKVRNETDPSSRMGTPQGAVISPIMANAYLHPLDVMLHDHGISHARYADDFILVSKSQEAATEALERTLSWFSETGLSLQPGSKKNNATMSPYNAIAQPVEFLGFRITQAGARIAPSPVKQMEVKRRIWNRTRGLTGPTAIPELIKTINKTLTAWWAYYEVGTRPRNVMEPLDRWTRKLIRHKVSRSQGRCRHGLRLPSDTELDAQGLVNLSNSILGPVDQKNPSSEEAGMASEGRKGMPPASGVGVVISQSTVNKNRRIS